MAVCTSFLVGCRVCVVSKGDEISSGRVLSRRNRQMCFLNIEKFVKEVSQYLHIVSSGVGLLIFSNLRNRRRTAAGGGGGDGRGSNCFVVINGA